MKLTKKKIYTLLMCVIMAVFTFFLSFQTPTFKTYASEDETIDFDSTNVIDDLLSADENFVSNFPPNENASPKIQVIQVVEYCYSYRENMRDNYGLYVYVYNPTNLNIVRHSKSNQIQIAVAYDSNPVTSSSLAIDYDKFDLEFCSVSVGEFSNLYYKFKVVDKVGKDGKTIAQRVNSAERRYDISGIELLTSGEYNATEYAVSQIYTFTGYSKGYGFDENIEESTLECSSRSFESVSLKLNHTYYRTETSSKGADFQNQINTVYFAVPNYFFEQYGTLQRIKAMWYEFETKDIIVTQDEDVYTSIAPYIGADMNGAGFDDYILGCDYWTNPSSSVNGDLIWGFNGWSWNYDAFKSSPSLYYFFPTKDYCDIDAYDPAEYVEDIGGVSRSDLLDYIHNYNSSYENGSVYIKENTISADLFEYDIDDYRKIENEFGVVQSGFNGRSVYDFDADILLDYVVSGDLGNFWANCDAYGFWASLFNQIPNVQQSFSPIHVVNAVDLQPTDTEISHNLFINEKDVEDIKTAYNNAVSSNCKLVLFRFSVTDYEQEMCYVGKESTIFDALLGNVGYKMKPNIAYRAKESVFLDFDVIQLTFSKDNKYYVIPVVASPIDVVADITPPVNWNDSTSLLQTILAVLLLILLIIILLALLPHLFSLIIWLLKGILKVVIWLISLPFKIFKKRE